MVAAESPHVAVGHLVQGREGLPRECMTSHARPWASHACRLSRGTMGHLWVMEIPEFIMKSACSEILKSEICFWEEFSFHFPIKNQNSALKPSIWNLKSEICLQNPSSKSKSEIWNLKSEICRQILDFRFQSHLSRLDFGADFRFQISELAPTMPADFRFQISDFTFWFGS